MGCHYLQVDKKIFFSCQKKKQISNDAFAGLNILKLAAPITNQKCEQLKDANSVSVREYSDIWPFKFDSGKNSLFGQCPKENIFFGRVPLKPFEGT